MQQVLTMHTDSDSLRSKADGFDWELEPQNVRQNKEIGLSPSGGSCAYCYDCPLKAIAAGWNLLAPPIENLDEPPELRYKWWFVREWPGTYGDEGV
jgi:hypothetical protein